VRPFVRGWRKLDLGIWRVLVVGGIPLLALTFFNLIYGTVNVPILHTLAGSDPVGWYMVALRWVGIPVFITTAVVSAFFPAFSQHGNPLTKEFAPLVNRAIQIVLLVTIPGAFGLLFIADDMVRLVYDQEFESSIVLIQILALQMPISALDTVLATALVASDRLNRYLLVAGIAATLNPVACVVAVRVTDERYGNGAIGAAVVMVATELWVMIGALWLRPAGVVDRTEVGRMARIVAATVVMAPLLLLTGHWPLPVQVLVGALTYGVAALAFGAITRAELGDLLQRFTSMRRRGGLVDGSNGGVGDGADAGSGGLAGSAEER
jgi:O-antigen/teichoic acid export membrane protein